MERLQQIHEQLRRQIDAFGDSAHHVASSGRFKRVFVGGHLVYFTGHTMHLPMGEVVTGVLAVVVAVEFVATIGGHDA